MKTSDRAKCSCCKECKDCTPGFQKVVDLKNAGLVIYRHTAHTEDVNKDTGKIEYATKTTEDVYILHNTKDMDLTSADYLPEIEQNAINCPRCRRIIEHAQKLLQKVPTINRNDVKGICEHCRTKGAPCFECEEVVKKFVARKSEQTENTKERVKQWLSKIKHLLKDDTKTDRERDRAHSELYIDQLCRESPKLGREPEVKQMFPPGTDFVGAFPPSIEKRIKMFAHFPRLEKLESPVVFLDPPEKNGKPSASTSRTKEGIDNGDKVYASDADSIDLRAMFYAPLSEKDKQKQEKHVELRVPPVPFHSEEDFILGKDESITEFEQILKTTRPKSRFYPSDEEPDGQTDKATHRGDRSQRRETVDLRPEPQAYARKLQQNKEDQRARLDIKLSLGSAKATKEKEIHGKTGQSPNFIRKYHSEEALLTKIAGVTEDVIKQDFSYVFPKILSPDKNKLKRQKSSSELIKDTQDMLLAKAEKEKKRLEDERKRKLEEEERKKYAREKKKQQLDAKSKADLEKKLLEETQKKEEKLDSTKKDVKEKPKKEKVTPTSSTATSKKESRPTSEKKPKEPKVPKEPKAPKEPKEPKEPKAPKELKEPKEPKEPKRDKEAEKAKKDLEKKEKEERLKKEKEEKEKLKKEKEEQLRKEREIKQKEKEELQRQKGDKQKNKEKVDPSSKLKDQEDNARQAEKDAAEKRAREEAKLLLKKAKEADAEVKQEPEKPKISKKVENPNTKDLNIKSIKVRNGPSPDDLILQLVKLKQIDKQTKPKQLADLGLTTKQVKVHKGSHKYKKPACIMCVDSDVELDAESIIMRKDEDEMADIIIGPKIFKYKPPLIDRRDDQDVVPLFFQSTFDDAKSPAKDVATSPKISPVITSGKQLQGKHVAEQEVPKGVIRYALSDRAFIDKGWTMLPMEKVVRKMNVYRMRPAQPEFDWFEHNKNKRRMQYDSGEKLAEFDDNGRGRWFYKNGRMALDYYDAEELNAQQRFVIYSSGDPDERGRAQPYTLLATFDYLGNGIVFDHSGKIRLKYNQTEGVVLDRSIGPVSHWKWHTLNDPPVLQQVMIDTQMAHKDPGILKLAGPHDNKPRPDNEDMLAIEFDNFIKEKSKKLSQTFKPFQIKMKALKINEHFSLKVLDQATVYLIFRDGTTNLKLNIGMVLDHKEIVDTDTAEVGEVSNNMERLPARTDSLAGLQKSIAHAQHYEKMRTERERRLCTAAPSGSADKLTAAASRPLRFPLRTGPSSLTASAANSYCKCNRKPITSNVYYDTRLC